MVWQAIDQQHNPAAFVGFLDALRKSAGYAEYKQRSIDLLRIARGMAVLDVGCGTGDDVIAISNIVGPDGFAAGIDASVTMIEEARRRTANASNTFFDVQDAHSLLWAPNLFDGVRADRVLQHVDDPEKVLSEMIRITKEDGLIVIAEPDWSTLVPLQSSGWEGDQLSIAEQLCKDIRHPNIGADLQKLFESAGLEDVYVESASISFFATVTGYGAVGRKRSKRLLHVVNDVHSRLNATQVKPTLPCNTIDDVRAELAAARRAGEKVCIAGGKHAMGSQQFLAGAKLIELPTFNRIIDCDPASGLVEVEAGSTWPQLIENLPKHGMQDWAITQKQTGCDLTTIGGALSSNVHGRGLNLKPIVGDVESFKILLSDGELLECSRAQNTEIFNAAIGGYGQLGVIYSARLQLTRRTTFQRRVQLCHAAQLPALFELAIANGSAYGDFQFAIDPKSDDFLQKGILSTYKSVAELPRDNKALSIAQWEDLLVLAHTNKQRAFDRYTEHYLATDGQRYDSSTFQLATYVQNYHARVDTVCGAHVPGSEIITELYVPRHKLPAFLAEAADLLRRRDANIIYGTVRLIEKDDQTMLPWARESFACIVFNLHIDHTAQDIARNSLTFRALIDLAISLGGSFYMTYHRYATKEQIAQCYPRLPEFKKLKEQLDPQGLFSSKWFETI